MSCALNYLPGPPSTSFSFSPWWPLVSLSYPRTANVALGSIIWATESRDMQQ